MTRREKVTKVIDGDTFQTASRKHPVRLANIDTPEKGERGYASAKQELQRLIGGKTVRVDTKARDSYNRSVANVSVGRASVNKAMKKHDK
jgi:micrococcal nuclease